MCTQVPALLAASALPPACESHQTGGMSGGMSVSAAQARVQRHRTPQTSTEEQTMLDLALAMSLSEATQQPEALDVSAPILSRTGADLQRRLSGSLPHANARMRQPAQQPGIDEDAALARRLQEEEDAAAATVVRPLALSLLCTHIVTTRWRCISAQWRADARASACRRPRRRHSRPRLPREAAPHRPLPRLQTTYLPGVAPRAASR